ncbi:MAG: thioredoxin domain-containing protein [Oligoflexia bacterium]|nr:thioredoxin domain-containing protein [Oligoflexia bacterium]MBF0365030.1 thioredoxin domain-containing protein [Oligoflexia bacterium]
MKQLLSIPLICVSFLLFSCTTEKQLKESMKKVIAEDPSVIISVIKARPLEFIEALQEAARTAQQEMGKQQEEESKKELESAFEKPLAPKIRVDENIRGPKDAPIVIVEYSDFECPYCSRGAKTVEELRKKYSTKIQFIYKHLPLDFHSKALISAKYYEAIRMQDFEKAWKFHDELFNNQKELIAQGEAYLKTLAKKIGADLNKLATDLNSKQVADRIEEDKKEATAFGFQGTPGFIINGVPLRGAYPISQFESIIEELKKRGKIKL